MQIHVVSTLTRDYIRGCTCDTKTLLATHQHVLASGCPLGPLAKNRHPNAHIDRYWMCCLCEFRVPITHDTSSVYREVGTTVPSESTEPGSREAIGSQNTSKSLRVSVNPMLFRGGGEPNYEHVL